jgi:O-antigen/teichoic acid export membrane protein
MTASAKALTFRRLTHRALSIGAIKASDKATQFLLPVVLVRCLDTATFGEYRLLWLLVGTVMTVATLGMTRGLALFTPHCEAERKRLYVHQTMLFLVASGLLFAALVGPWNAYLPAAVAPLQAHGTLVPAFVGLWIVASMLDSLPTVDERIRWQAYATVGTSLLRTVLVGAGAWASSNLSVIFWLLLAVVVIKLALLFTYVRRYHGMGAPWFELRTFADQFRRIAPFGLAGALYALRSQADQWVAATLFAIQSFAAFSVAAVLSPLVSMFRRSVVDAFIPSMSRLQAAGDVNGMLEMNSRGNVLVGMLLYPLLAFVFAFAHELVTVVYTAAYLEAAPVMRVYIVGLAVLVVEISSVLLLLKQGSYALGVNALALTLSVLTSWTLGSTVGLAGAAGGSVLAICLERMLTLRRIAARVGIPVGKLQNWRGLAMALGYAAASAALLRIAVDALLPDGAALRLALGGCGLALVYVPILLRWRTR